ncbi:hypothetical protein COLO4_19863 [Corchorus olitorius]|uniref:Uncharacterized protein n=1 Tax=Corchorus olitorius TaxID=93759 RepID=A0A1R3J2Y4_9ROSI|nr:hypothetical protein COLO4_19863 [Corchorus olitorius]
MAGTLSNMCSRLSLQDEEAPKVIIEKEWIEGNDDEGWFSLIGKMPLKKSPNLEALKKAMINALRLEKTLVVKEVGESGGRWLRIRAWVNILKPVTAILTLTTPNADLEGKVRYDKLPDYCWVCVQRCVVRPRCGDEVAANSVEVVAVNNPNLKGGNQALEKKSNSRMVILPENSDSDSLNIILKEDPAKSLEDKGNDTRNYEQEIGTQSPFVFGVGSSSGSRVVRKWKKATRVSSKYVFDALALCNESNVKVGQKRGSALGILETSGAIKHSRKGVEDASDTIGAGLVKEGDT